MAKHLDTGEWGEKVAEAALKGKKYRILGRRVRVDDRSEIDLVARDGEVLVFVEVKTRSSSEYGRPASAVDRRKRHILSRAAVRYIKSLKKRDLYIRFDVVEVIGSMDGGDPIVRHIENAFTLDKQYYLPM